MAIRVLTERLARQGYGLQLVQAILAHYQPPSTHRPARTCLRIFESVDEPKRVLTLEKWATRADFQQYVDTHHVSFMVFDAWSAGPPTRRFLDCLDVYEQPSAPAVEAVCVTYAWPTAAHMTMQRLVDEQWRQLLQAEEHCVARRVYGDPEDPNFRFIVTGWETQAPPVTPPSILDTLATLQRSHEISAQWGTTRQYEGATP